MGRGGMIWQSAKQKTAVNTAVFWKYETLWQSVMGWMMGIEPTTSGITIRRSNHLSYTHHL